MKIKQQVAKLIECVNILHTRIERIESDKPFEVNVDNVTMKYLDELISLKKQQLEMYKQELFEIPQSPLSIAGLERKIDNRYDELSRLYVIKSLKEMQ